MIPRQTFTQFLDLALPWQKDDLHINKYQLAPQGYLNSDFINFTLGSSTKESYQDPVNSQEQIKKF